MLNNRKKIADYKREIVLLVNDWDTNAAKLSIDSGYNKILNALDQMNSKYDSVHSAIEKIKKELAITISKRFFNYCSEDLRKEVDDYNIYMREELDTLNAEVNEKYFDNKDDLKNKLEEWNSVAAKTVKSDPELYQLILKERLQIVLDNSNMMLHDVNEKISANYRILLQEMGVVRKLLNSIEAYDSRIKSSERYKMLSDDIKRIPLFEEEIDNVFNCAPGSIAKEGDQLLEKLENSYQEIYKSLQLMQIDVDGIFKDDLQNVRRIKPSENIGYSDEDLIGELRLQNISLQSENEIYSDLANLGLASEIVSHEFNQLYTNVRNAIRNLMPYIEEANAKYWLKQIEVGFRAVSDRQNQLSPMYRSYSLRKRNMNLREFIREICSFMDNLLEKEGICIDNQIDNKVEVNISPSKMFPAISNIVNNASYWVLNQELPV